MYIFIPEIRECSGIKDKGSTVRNKSDGLNGHHGTPMRTVVVDEGDGNNLGSTTNDSRTEQDPPVPVAIVSQAAKRREEEELDRERDGLDVEHHGGHRNTALNFHPMDVARLGRVVHVAWGPVRGAEASPISKILSDGRDVAENCVAIVLLDSVSSCLKSLSRDVRRCSIGNSPRAPSWLQVVVSEYGCRGVRRHN